MIEPGDLATFGPFFAVDTHGRPPTGPWRPIGALARDRTAMAARIEQVRGALSGAAGSSGSGGSAGQAGSEIEPRVATSVAHLGLIARLVAPVLGLAALGHPAPAPALAELHWQPELGGPFPLSLPHSAFGTAQTGARIAAPAAPDAALHALLDGPVRELTEGVSAVDRLSSHVLWGNVASAMHSAGRLATAARPDLAARIGIVTDGALAHPLLSGEHRGVTGRFRRRSCCLIYRAGGPGARSLCGDCALGLPEVVGRR